VKAIIKMKTVSLASTGRVFSNWMGRLVYDAITFIAVYSLTTVSQFFRAYDDIAGGFKDDEEEKNVEENLLKRQRKFPVTFSFRVAFPRYQSCRSKHSKLKEMSGEATFSWING
jgi:hypothetical protein